MMGDFTTMDKELQDFLDSSLLLQNVFSDAEQGIIVMDTNLHYVYWNSFLTKLTGMSLDDVKYKTPNDLFPFLEDNGLVDNLKNVIKKGIQHKKEFKFSQENKDIWVLNHANPIKNKKEEIIGILTIVTDITNQKETEEKLRTSQDRLQLINKGKRDGLWDWSFKDNKIKVSESWKSQLGYANDEYEVGLESWQKLLHPEDKERVNTYFEKCLENGTELYENEFRLKHKNGSYKWIKSKGIIVRDANGNPIRLAGSHTDISEEKNKELIILENNRIFHELIGEVPGMIYQYRFFPDGSCSFPYSNNQIQEIYEVKPEDVKEDGSIVMSRIHEDDHNKILNSIHVSMQNLSIWEETFRVVLPKKGLRWIHARSKPKKLDDGSYLWNGYQKDVTSVKEAEEKIKESQERWQFALEGSEDGVWDWNLTSDELYLSPQWKAMFGYKDHELENKFKEWEVRAHPEDVENTKKALDDYINGKTDFYANEHRIKCKDDTYKWVYDRGKIIAYDKSGNPSRMIGTKTDITHHRKLEKKLRDLIENKKQFISILGHDLKGPLSTSIGILEHLVNKIEKLDKKAIEKEADLVLKSTKQTFQLLDDILEWSKLNSDDITFQPVELKAKDLLVKNYNDFEIRAKSKSINLQLEPTKNIVFYADSNMILTVLRNLIGNAIKYTNSDGKVSLGANKKGRNIIFYVKDNGTGMSNELLKKLFVSKKLLSATGTAKEKGTGLGLLLCKGIIDKHNGKIWAESKEGKGSTFFFSIPLKPC